MEKSGTTVRRRSTSSVPCPENVRTLDSLLSVAPLLEDITERAGLGISINDSNGDPLYTSKGYHRLLEGASEIMEDAIIVELEDRTASLRLLSTPSECDRATLYLAKMALIGEVSVGLAHDFRNLLVVLGNNLREMKSMVSQAGNSYLDELTDEMEMALEAAAELCFRTEGLASRKIQPRPVDLSRLLSDTLRMASHLLRKAEAENKKITVDCDVQQGLWASAVPSDLQLAVINILSNALSHGFEPGAEGNISVRGFSSSGMACVTIANDGKPIPQEIQDVLLARPVDSRKGHGFGLYASAKALRAAGGDLDMSSCVGATIFMISLPRCGGLQ